MGVGVLCGVLIHPGKIVELVCDLVATRKDGMLLSGIEQAASVQYAW
jgi:hypothetical protein